MRAFCIFAILIVLAGCATAAQADTTHYGWICQVLLRGTAGQEGGDKGTYGALQMTPEASDGYDAWDRALFEPPVPVYFGVYHANGIDGWGGLTGFYCVDARTTPPPEIGRSVTWTLYVWAGAQAPLSASAMDFSLRLMGGDPRSIDASLVMISKPASVTGGPEVGTRWNLSQTPARFDLPAFRTANGLEGYVFDFTATVIPEPSSLLALLAGLGGLGGMMWRRRR